MYRVLAAAGEVREFLLGHADSRMVERVYGRLDPRSLGKDVGLVFNKLDLPTVQVPKERL